MSVVYNAAVTDPRIPPNLFHPQICLGGNVIENRDSLSWVMFSFTGGWTHPNGDMVSSSEWILVSLHTAAWMEEAFWINKKQLQSSDLDLTFSRHHYDLVDMTGSLLPTSEGKRITQSAHLFTLVR